ncbi:MAG TPA: phosphate regulon transcriptional regulator PhoB [Hyphomicrobiaceae bacterium]|nr:phosphate regulon transcriptional regulator PhoB [Hyphomicrobiaceae bacterium]
MTIRILVVEDDPAISTLLAYNLEAAGYAVTTVTGGEDAELHLASSTFDLVILDWMLPEMTGIEFCARLRKSGGHPQLPVLMLTARGEEADRVRGLSTGADDYVVKPFSVPELMARITALLRRASPERMNDVIGHGDITLDRTAHRVTRGVRAVELGPTEFRLLVALIESRGRVLTRAQLIDRVWGNASDIDDRTVDVHIGRLRKALIRGKEADPIRTVRGTGYALTEPGD